MLTNEGGETLKCSSIKSLYYQRILALVLLKVHLLANVHQWSKTAGTTGIVSDIGVPFASPDMLGELQMNELHSEAISPPLRAIH